MAGHRFVSSVMVSVFAAGVGAGAIPPREIEVTAVPVLGWGPGVDLTYGFAAGRKGEVIAGLGYNFIDVSFDIASDNNKSHGFARAKVGFRYYPRGGLRGFYLQPEVGVHLQRYEVYYEGYPRGWRDYKTYCAAPAVLVGGRWVFRDRISLRVGGGGGPQIPWEFGDSGTFPFLPRLDVCLGYAF
jgi:hypothetical protein